MATKFVTNLDLNRNQILNATFEVLAADPTTNLFEGRMYYNSTYDIIRYYNGSQWKLLVNGVVSGGASSAALTINEASGQITVTPNLATSSTPGVMSASDKAKLDNSTSEATGITLALRDVNGQAKFGTPTDDAHAATKGYVDAARSGLDVKQSVRVATTEPINIASDLEAGDVIDGVTLVAGDRVLVKNQSTASENGIYVAVASGAASRSTDADSSAEVTAGMFTFVAEGSTNADSGWVLTTNDTISLGTTPLVFAQFSGAGQITAGEGLSKLGNVLNVNYDTTTIFVNGVDELAVNSSSIQYQTLISGGTEGSAATWGAVALDQPAAISGTLPISNGGTGATSASAVRESIAAGGTQGDGVSVPVVARKVSKTIGDGLSTSFTVQHGFGTREVMVQVYDAATYDTVIADTIRTDTNTVTVQFSVAPLSNSYVAVVIG